MATTTSDDLVRRTKNRRLYAPIILGFFFLTAMLICLVAAITLLAPGSPVDGVWSIKPVEYQQLLALAPWSGVGFVALSVAMAFASLGTFTGSRWGWWLAVAIFAINGLGDAAQVLFGRVVEGVVGVLAAGLVLLVMTRPRIRSSFGISQLLRPARTGR